MQPLYQNEQSLSMFQRPDTITDKLYVIDVFFNSQRFRARWKHHANYVKHILDSGAWLITVEAAFGNRAFTITPYNERHAVVHVRAYHEIWLKECLINIGFRHLPEAAKYVAWIDNDIHIMRPDWVGETLHQLQHYDMVQMFSQIAQLDINNQIIGTGPSFMAGYLKAYKLNVLNKEHSYTDGIATKLDWQGAPGGAWAAKRSAIDKLGGLIDFVILGSGDYFMALGLLGYLEVDKGIGYHPAFTEELITWQERAVKYLKKNIGMVSGLITHGWHGKMSNRGYGDRWKILVKHKFNPRVDIRKDIYGVYQLGDDKPDMRDDIKNYFQNRNEDSTD